MPFWGNFLSTNRDYYSTLLGIIIVTDWQVIEMDAPTLPTLESVCRAFGITLAQFFAEGDEPVQMTDEQRILFSRWNPLTDEQKRLLLDLMKTM